MDNEISVAEFLAFTNQILENAFPQVKVYGEISQLKIWRNQLAFFDLKDDEGVINCMIPIAALTGVEEGMNVLAIGRPRLTNKGRFSLSAHVVLPKGEGALKKSFDILRQKLEKEGLFDDDRKRILPYPPKAVGLITAADSAACADFIKILNERWSGVDVQVADVQVQGEIAISQITKAIDYFNQQSTPPDVIVVTRGGGSAEDLVIFNTEQITRAVAASRVPMIVAVGHEIDTSLAELVADRRASTPSNAAQMLVPDKRHYLESAKDKIVYLESISKRLVSGLQDENHVLTQSIRSLIVEQINRYKDHLSQKKHLLLALNPNQILKKGYAILRKAGTVVGSETELSKNDDIEIDLYKRRLIATINKVELNNG